MLHRHALGFSLVALAQLACSPDPGPLRKISDLSGTGGYVNVGGAGSGTGGVLTGDPGTGFGGGFIDPGETKKDPNAGPDGSCAATTVAAEQQTIQVPYDVTVTVTEQSPISLYLMQDISGSMLEPILPPTKWDQTKSAITAFVNDANSKNIEVALQYFALPVSGCDNPAYATPDVPMGPLPQNATNIVNSLNSKIPLTGTPIEPALRGVTSYCVKYIADNPGKQCVAVLITDGEPSDCATDPAALAAIAADAKTKGVITFTIGMQGANFDTLSQIARAGGSDCTPNTPGAPDEACNVSGGSSSFVDALNTIRTTTTHTETHQETKTEYRSTKLACEFKLPEPPKGQSFDREKVNVQFTSDSGIEKIYRVPTEADCAGTSNKAWYYDDEANPTKILVCKSTCDVLEAATGDGGTGPSATAPRVDVLLGCASEDPPA